MKAIINTKLILEDGIIFDGALTYENGKILQADRADKVRIPEDAEILDAKGLYTAPGLIDIHNHGSADDMFVDEPMKCCEHFILHGQTTVLPTFYCSLTLEQMLEGAQKVQMGDVDRSSLFRKHKTKLTHGSTPLLPHSLRRSRCTGCDSQAW